MKDYRVKVAVKNNRLLTAIERAGYESVAAFARACGVRYQEVINLIAMRITATSSKGEWRSLVTQIADFLQVNPNDLFNERQAVAGFDQTTGNIEMDDPSTLFLADCGDAFVDANVLKSQEQSRVLETYLQGLNAREKDILLKRHGYEGDEKTLEEIGDEYGVSRSRIAEIEKNALRKLRVAMRREGHLLHSWDVA